MTGDRIEVSPAAVYHDGLAEGRLRYQRCRACGTAVFFPRVMCPHCASPDLEWAESGGAGTVYSTTTTRSRSGDSNISLIDLDEGFRMMCTVRDDLAEPVRIGDRVEAVIPPGTTAETLCFRRTGTP